MKRLFNDPAMPSELRADLLRSRAAGRDYDAFAKLPELRSALKDPARPTPEELTSSESLGSLGRTTWSKLQLAPWSWKAALLAVIGGATLFAAWPTQPETGSARPAQMKPPPIAAAVRAPSVREVEAPAVEPAPAPVADAPAELAPAPKTVERSSSREVAQLVRIRALLERDPAAAYRLARRSEQEFPRGVLSEERQALQVLALAKNGAPAEARREARRFFGRFPESPMRARLEAALRP